MRITVEIWEISDNQIPQYIATENVNVPPSSIAARGFYDFSIGRRDIASVVSGDAQQLPRIFVHP